MSTVDPRASVGTQVNLALEKLGISDAQSDMIGMMIDLQRGDLGGAMRNLVDLQSGIPSSQLQEMLKGPQGPAFGAGRIQRHRCGGAHFSRCGNTYIHQEQVGKKARIGQKYGVNWGGFQLEGRITGRQYRGSFAKPVQLANDKLLYQGRVYDNLGSIWKDVKDGKLDGLATSRRLIPNLNQFPMMPPGIFGAAGAAAGAVASAAGQAMGMASGAGFAAAMGAQLAAGSVMSAIAGQANGIFDGIKGGLEEIIRQMTQGSQGQQPGQVGGGGGGGVGGMTPADDTSAILGSGASLEDKLLVLMAKLAQHMDKQIEDQMKKIEAEMAKQEKGADKAGGGGGFFGKLLGGAGAAIGGPLGGMAGSMLGGLMGGGGGGAGGASGSGDSQKSNLQLLQTQLQQMLERRSQMFQLFTSMFKTMHDTSMGIVRNTKA